MEAKQISARGTTLSDSVGDDGVGMLKPLGTSRSDRGTARSNPSTIDQQETFRTSMSTARVQTALAALTAEKQALLAKLAVIDSALETGEKKKASKPRPHK
eukprot:gene13743-18434_t